MKECKEWSPITHPVLQTSFIDDSKPCQVRKSVFGKQMKIMAQWSIPDERPSDRQSVIKKQMHSRNKGTVQDLIPYFDNHLVQNLGNFCMTSVSNICIQIYD